MSQPDHFITRFSSLQPFRHPIFHSTHLLSCLPCVQRKSNRAKEKKARRLEERAAMDAVCAKVDAANKVIWFGCEAGTAVINLGRGPLVLPGGDTVETVLTMGGQM